MDYQKLYTLLFNHMTDALEQLQKNNFGLAKDILVRGQQEAEQLYLILTDGQEGEE